MNTTVLNLETLAVTEYTTPFTGISDDFECTATGMFKVEGDKDDGVNFQNIIEGAPVFERMIDNPAWTPLAQKYINPVNGVSIHENFLNVRPPGGFLYIHCGGHTPLQYLTFRNHNTGEWIFFVRYLNLYF